MSMVQRLEHIIWVSEMSDQGRDRFAEVKQPTRSCHSFHIEVNFYWEIISEW